MEREKKKKYEYDIIMGINAWVREFGVRNIALSRYAVTQTKHIRTTQERRKLESQ